MPKEFDVFVVGITGTGFDIDRQRHVPDSAGRGIPGHYAGGETAGFGHGKRYGDGGFSIGTAVILRREAGKEAASQALVKVMAK